MHHGPVTQDELRAEVAKVPGARYECLKGDTGHSIEGVWLQRNGKDYEMSFDVTNVSDKVVEIMRGRLLRALAEIGSAP